MKRAITRPRALSLWVGLWSFVSVLASNEAALAGPGVGDPAPEFSLMGSDGRLHSLAEHRGHRGVVLAWFPRTFTPG